MARKTIDVSTVVTLANAMLDITRPEMVKEREGIIALTESILHQTGNYKGFRTLWNHESRTYPQGETVIANPMRNIEERDYEITDDSRRAFYQSVTNLPKLKV